MFLDYAGVLDGHEPTSEWNHLRAELHVLVVEGRPSKCGLTHNPSLSGAPVMRKDGSASQDDDIRAAADNAFHLARELRHITVRQQ
jgi:hypothetical protein